MLKGQSTMATRIHMKLMKPTQFMLAKGNASNKLKEGHTLEFLGLPKEGHTLEFLRLPNSHTY